MLSIKLHNRQKKNDTFLFKVVKDLAGLKAAIQNLRSLKTIENFQSFFVAFRLVTLVVLGKRVPSMI